MVRSQIQKEIWSGVWKQQCLRMILLDEVPRKYMAEPGNNLSETQAGKCSASPQLKT